MIENCNNKEPTADMCLRCESKCLEGYKEWRMSFIEENDRLPHIREVDEVTREVRYEEWGWHGSEV